MALESPYVNAIAIQRSRPRGRLPYRCARPRLRSRRPEPREGARRQARIDFGGREQITQQLREVHISALLEAARANARAAFRFLRKAPGLSAAVILTLALGIGANTAVFSAIEAVILRPLPFPEGDQLMAIRSVQHPHQ